MSTQSFEVPAVVYTNRQALSYYGQRSEPRVDGTTLNLELAWTDQPDLAPPSWLPYETLTISSKLYGEERFRRVGDEWGTPLHEGRMWFFYLEGGDSPARHRVAVLGLRLGSLFGFLRILDSFGGGWPKPAELDFQLWPSPVVSQRREVDPTPCHARSGPIYYKDLVAEAGAPVSLLQPPPPAPDDPLEEQVGTPVEFEGPGAHVKPGLPAVPTVRPKVTSGRAVSSQRRGTELQPMSILDVEVSAYITNAGSEYHQRFPVGPQAGTLNLQLTEEQDPKTGEEYLQLVTENPEPKGQYRLQGRREGYEFLNDRIYFFRYELNLDPGDEPTRDVHRMVVLGMKGEDFGFLREVDALWCEMPEGDLDQHLFSSPVHPDFVGGTGTPGDYDVRYFADLVVEGGSPAALS